MMALSFPIDDFEEDVASWKADAACRGEPHQAFFPDNPDTVPAEVRALCSTCPVREDCLEHGLEFEPYGIWGGTSEAAIGRLRRRQTRRAS